MRDYKSFAPNEYYHVFNRGNGQMDIFRDHDDYDLFQRRLTEALHPDRVKGALSQGRNQRRLLAPGLFSLLAYCFMPNHFHLLVLQRGDVPISTLMLKVCGSYSRLFNKKYQRVGSLFQDQFRAVHIESNDQLLWASSYIHQNPTLAGLVDAPEAYRYSSFSEYLQATPSSLCDTAHILRQFKSRSDYRAFVGENLAVHRARKDAEGALSHV